MKIKNILRNGLAGIVLAASFFLGCGKSDVKEETSERMFEDAVVSEVSYTPSRIESQQVYNDDLEEYVSKDVEIPAVYTVVFRGRRQGFYREGSDPEYLVLYNRFKDKKGMPVRITYELVYSKTLEDTNRDGKKEEIRMLKEIKFIDVKAVKAK